MTGSDVPPAPPGSGATAHPAAAAPSGPPDADSADASQRSRSVGSLIWAGVREVFIVVGLAVALSLLVKTFLVQPFHIPSGSMENTLVKDDRVIVSKLTPGPIDLQRGDIVVFSDPDGWLGEVPALERSPLRSALVFLGLVPDDSHEHLIKRVVGLPGDHVVCCTASGQVTINGVAITEPYLKPGDTPGGGRATFDIVVPPGRFWVMGDHRSDSADSRFHDDGTGATGSVPLDSVIGRAVTVVWPLDRVRWLSVSDRVFVNVPAPAGSNTSTGAPGGSTGSASPTPSSSAPVPPGAPVP